MSAHLDAVSACAVRPSTTDRYLAHGPSPVRVLLVGNGIALGFGVDSRAATLDGRIGEQIVRRSGRGVVVNNWTQDSSRLRQQALTIVAGMNLQSEDVVVWCPSYHELLERPSSGHWRSSIGLLVENIAPSVAIVITLLPAIESSDFNPTQLNIAINRINHAVRRRVTRLGNVAVCEPPAVAFDLSRDYLYDETYYAALGAKITELVFTLRPALRRPASSDVDDGPVPLRHPFEALTPHES